MFGKYGLAVFAFFIVQRDHRGLAESGALAMVDDGRAGGVIDRHDYPRGLGRCQRGVHDHGEQDAWLNVAIVGRGWAIAFKAPILMLPLEPRSDFNNSALILNALADNGDSVRVLGRREDFVDDVPVKVERALLRSLIPLPAVLVEHA